MTERFGHSLAGALSQFAEESERLRSIPRREVPSGA